MGTAYSVKDLEEWGKENIKMYVKTNKASGC
jgi:hypothetical protein